VSFFTSRDGVRLHYELEGDGPPLVLHLGAGCDADVWRAAGYVDALAPHCQCVLFDHRGHGKSDHPSSSAANHIDRYADDVTALVAHLGHSSVAFFGWSNGVPVGLKVAAEHPQLLDRMILFGPMAPRMTAEQLAAAMDVHLAGLRESGWWYLLDDFVAAEKQPVPRWFLDRVVATDIVPYLGWTEARPSWNWSPWDTLPHVDAPTLIIVGELEDPDDVMGQAASLMPSATRVRIADREHINAFVDSALVLPHVIEFLAAHRPAVR